VALAKERDMLKKMISDRLTAASRDKPTQIHPQPDGPSTAVALEKDGSTFHIPKDLRSAKAFFLGEKNFTATYQPEDDTDYDVQDQVVHPIPSELLSDVEEDDFDENCAAEDAEDEGAPPPIPSSEIPSSPPPVTTEGDDNNPTDCISPDRAMVNETPPSASRSTAKRNNTSSRRTLFGGFAATLRKQFNKNNSKISSTNHQQQPQQQAASATEENPWFNDDSAGQGGADLELQPSPQITFMSSTEDEVVGPQTKRTKKVRRRSRKAGGVPTKSNHDESVELRNQLKEAEHAVQVKTRLLNDARWVNSKVTYGSDAANRTSSQDSNSVPFTRQNSASVRGGGYTRGMKVKKSRDVPDWRKAVEADISREKERLREARAQESERVAARMSRSRTSKTKASV
jgi:hypothetical protein